MPVRASAIQTVADGGSGDMGDVTDSMSAARFTLDADDFVLVFIRVTTERIQGTPSTTDEANLTIKVDNNRRDQFNHSLKTITGIGPTRKSSYIFRIVDEEQSQFIFRRGDVIVLEWTNPDAGDIRWTAEVGLADVASAF